MDTEKNKIIAQWLVETHQRLQKSLNKKRIGQTQDLYYSLFSRLQMAGTGDVQKAVISFLLYGTYVDMGVGNGTTMGEAIQGARQRKRNWASKTLYSQQLYLGEQMLNHYGDLAIEEALKKLPTVLESNI